MSDFWKNKRVIVTGGIGANRETPPNSSTTIY